MKIAIIGCGALGSVIGSLLMEAGLEVAFIERDSSEVALIRSQGLRVEGVSGDRFLLPNIFEGTQDVGLCELALVLVKSYDTHSTIPTLREILPPEGTILTLQNGLGNYEILDAAFPGRILLGTTTMGAMTVSAGHVRHTGLGNTHIGEADGNKSERAEKIAALLEKMKGGPVHVTDNAVGSLWSKLVINAAINAPCSLLRIRNGDLPGNPFGRSLIHEIVSECQAIIEAKGLRLIFEDPEDRVLEVCKGTGQNICSMLQDIRAGRRTEIDFINGALSLEADRLGLAAPVNKTLSLLIRALEETDRCRLGDSR